ncbi:BLOC-1-related complex subunit 7 isoform 1-T1 [Alca torda]
MAVPAGHRRRALGPRASLAAPGRGWEAGGCLQLMAALQGDRRERCLRPSLHLCALRAGHRHAPHKCHLGPPAHQPCVQLLGQAARNMVMQEDAILHSEDSLRKMAIITTHLQYQQEAIQKNVEQSSNLQDQLSHLLK